MAITSFAYDILIRVILLYILATVPHSQVLVHHMSRLISEGNDGNVISPPSIVKTESSFDAVDISIWLLIV